MIHPHRQPWSCARGVLGSGKDWVNLRRSLHLIFVIHYPSVSVVCIPLLGKTHCLCCPCIWRPDELSTPAVLHSEKSTWSNASPKELKWQLRGATKAF